MNRKIVSIFCIGVFWISASARAVDLNISASRATILSRTEMILSNVHLSSIANPVSVKLRWNSQTDAFDAVEFSTPQPSPAGVIEGSWTYTWDVGCDGKMEAVNIPLIIHPGGKCVTGSPLRPCSWWVNPAFVLSWQNDPDYLLVGTFTGTQIVGSIRFKTNPHFGCFKATRGYSETWRPFSELQN